MLEQPVQIVARVRDPDSCFRLIRHAPVPPPKTAVPVTMATKGKGKQ